MKLKKKKVKIGVAGCGLISQIMHLPHFLEMEEFEVTSLCDVSASTLKAVAEKFKIKKTFQEYKHFLKSDIDAVLIAVRSSLHPDMVVQAAESGKDIFVEKDMCLSIQQADFMIERAGKNKAIVMVGHDRRYDPGFRKGVQEIKKMKNIKMVRVHLNSGAHSFFIPQYKIDRYRDDVPKNKKEESAGKRKSQIEEALGEKPSEQLINALEALTGAGTHQIVIIQAAFGNPEKILSAEIDPTGYNWAITMRLPEGIPCVCTKVNTPELADYQETMNVYGTDKVVSIEYPAPFLKNQPARVIVKTQEKDTFQETLLHTSFAEGFKEELRHFYNCIINRQKPESDLEVGRDNLKALLSIIEAYQNHKQVSCK